MKRMLLASFVGGAVGAILSIALYCLFIYFLVLLIDGPIHGELRENLWRRMRSEPELVVHILGFGIGFGAVTGATTKGLQIVAETVRTSVQAVQREIGEQQRFSSVRQPN